jgi:hypothetical protein
LTKSIVDLDLYVQVAFDFLDRTHEDRNIEAAKTRSATKVVPRSHRATEGSTRTACIAGRVSGTTTRQMSDVLAAGLSFI